MARKSRKIQAEILEESKLQQSDKVYRAGLYARISVENERKRESDTIGTQIQLLKNFVSER